LITGQHWFLAGQAILPSEPVKMKIATATADTPQGVWMHAQHTSVVRILTPTRKEISSFSLMDRGVSMECIGIAAQNLAHQLHQLHQWGDISSQPWSLSLPHTHSNVCYCILVCRFSKLTEQNWNCTWWEEMLGTCQHCACIHLVSMLWICQCLCWCQ
jgi:hypothetical protein